jgi:hypothetical protein
MNACVEVPRSSANDIYREVSRRDGDFEITNEADLRAGMATDDLHNMLMALSNPSPERP